jgi:hypothetical protein
MKKRREKTKKVKMKKRREKTENVKIWKKKAGGILRLTGSTDPKIWFEEDEEDYHEERNEEDDEEEPVLLDQNEEGRGLYIQKNDMY